MQRQSNIELCRIISILFVVFLHSDFSVFGYPSNLNYVKWPLILGESFSIIGVNVFLIISGFFSISIKKKSLFNLFYICLFYSILRIFVDIVCDSGISFLKFFFISRSNWFIPCYIGLLLFSSFLNQAKFLDKKKYKRLLFSIIIFVFWFDIFPAVSQIPLGIQRGYSVFHFIVMYLIGKYIYLYDVPSVVFKHSFLLYFLSSFALFILVYFVQIFSETDFLIKKLFAYSNPIIIFSSICFFISFKKISFGINKVINYLAQSVLAVLLIHSCEEAIIFLHPYYHFLYDQYSGFICVILWLISILTVFFISVLVDQIRIFSYKYISSKIIIP